MSLTCVRTKTDRVIELWADLAAQDAASDRRHFVRFPFFRPVSVLSDGLERNAFSRDISARGLGLIHNQSLQLGPTKVFVSLAKSVVVADFEVCWCKEVGNGWWVSGGRLNTTWSRYFSILKAAMAGNAELRRHERYSFCRPAVLRHGMTGLECKACSLDISLGGICLLTDRDLGQQELSVRIDSDGEQLDVRGDVVRCSEVLSGIYTCAIAFKRLQIMELH